MNRLFSRKRRSEASYEFRDIGFHGDQHLLAVVDDIVVRERIELFIETGTNVGSTLVYLATRYPQLKALSCEQDDEAWRRAREHTRALPNVEVHHLASADFLKLLARQADLFGKRCLFWLDAHGYGFEWPLKEEVRFIAENFRTGFVMIDDFKVPELDCFRYDEYKGQVCSYDFVRESLGRRPHQVFAPRYTDRTSKHHPLVGWGLIVLGAEYRVPVALQGLLGPVDVQVSSITGRPAVHLGIRAIWRRFATTRMGEPIARLRGRRLAWKAIAEWIAAGRPVPPPHAYKQRVVSECGRRFGARVLVETGTYLGDMLEAVQPDFEELYSIELDGELHQRAVQRFARRDNVTILRGDSATVLPQLLNRISNPALFWLDGHYSAGITARGDKDTPVLAELEAIARHSVRDHVILIDDARCFDGSHDYPSLRDIRNFALRHWPGHTFDVKDDIVRILPRVALGSSSR